MDKETLIERYFEGTLNDEEQIEFNKLIAEDVDFKKDVDFQKNVKVSIALHERSQLKEKLAGFEVELKNKKQFLSSRKWLSVAAVFLVFISVGYLFLFDSSKEVDLYNEYYQFYPNIEMPATRGTTSVSLQQQAFLFYDSGNFSEAELLFNQIYQESREEYALLYRGICFMEMNNFEAAVDTFTTIDINNSTTYSDKISWYLALCYLKLGQEEAAKTLLVKVKNREGVFKNQALDLLEKLK